MGFLDSALLGMFLTQMMANAAFSVMAPYYPSVAVSKGMSTSLMGWVFSCYPIAAWISSPILGRIITRYGRKKVFILGGSIIGIITSAFALLPLLDYGSFVFFSFFFRLIQGIGGAAIGGSSFAIIASNYRERMEVILGIQQSMASAGLMLGPLIGTGLYSVGGFSFMFIALGLNFFAFVPYACWVLPKDKPYMKSDAEVKITDLLRNFGVMSVGGILVIAMLNLTALAPVLTEHLASYGVDRALAGLFFTIPTLTYSMCIVIISKLPKTVSRVKILVLGLFMSFLAMVFIGPWEYIGLPRNLIMVVFGLLNLGIGMCLCILPCLPIMVKKAQYDMPYHNSEHVSDAITSLTLFCFFSGQILGPPLSGLLREKAGFDNGFVILGLISLIYAVFFTFASKKLTSTMMPTLETPLYQEMVTARRNEIVLNEDL